MCQKGLAPVNMVQSVLNLALFSTQLHLLLCYQEKTSKQTNKHTKYITNQEKYKTARPYLNLTELPYIVNPFH